MNMYTQTHTQTHTHTHKHKHTHKHSHTRIVSSYGKPPGFKLATPAFSHIYPTLNKDCEKNKKTCVSIFLYANVYMFIVCFLRLNHLFIFWLIRIKLLCVKNTTPYGLRGHGPLSAISIFVTHLLTLGPIPKSRTKESIFRHSDHKGMLVRRYQL